MTPAQNVRSASMNHEARSKFGQLIDQIEETSIAICLGLMTLIGLLGLEHWRVMGGATVGFVAGGACFVPLRIFVIRYRELVVEKLSNSKLFKTGTNPWLLRLIKWFLLGSGR